MGFSSRPLALPNAKTWSDVFVDVAPWRDSTSRAPEGWANPWRLPDVTRRGRMVDCPIGPFCSFRGTETHRASYVKARPEVYEAIKGRTIHTPDDVMSFQIVIRDDGTALVTCDHSRIIGGVWIALIDAKTIPPQREG